MAEEKVSEKIRKAVFGLDVREFIAQGIEATEKLREEYDAQVINAGKSNAEIVDARGGATNLKTRLDNSDAMVKDNLNNVIWNVNNRKPYDGVLCDFLDLNPSSGDIISVDKCKSQLTNIKNVGINSIVFQPWVTFNNTTNKCEWYKADVTRITNLLEAIKEFGMEIRCFKLHFTGVDFDAIVANNKLAAFENSYKTLVTEIFSVAKNYNIKHAIVFNEYNKLYGKADYSQFVVDVINIGKSNGFITGISTMGAEESVNLPQAVKNAVDMFYVNSYPRMSFKGDRTNRIDTTESWNNSYETKAILELIKTKGVIISETGCNNYWECLANPGDWVIESSYIASNGHAPALMLEGLFRSELNGLVGEIWWCYHNSIFYDLCKLVITKYTGVIKNV